MSRLFTNTDIVDALIVAAMFIVVGVIVAVCAATVYRRFAAMSGPPHPHPRRRA